MERKNIILILSDGHQTGALGCYGNLMLQTPHIDALAQHGTFFQHCLTPSPLCHAAHSSLWTGLLPHKCQLREEENRSRQSATPIQSLVHPFVEAGYHTIYAGKWSLTGYTPASFGFLDQAIITDSENDITLEGRAFKTYRNYVTTLGYHMAVRSGIRRTLTERDLSLLSQSGKAPCGTSEIPLRHYAEPWITQQAIQALERRPSEKPFWVVASYRAPHFPLIVPEPYDRLYPPESVSFPPNFQTGRAGHAEGSFFSEDEWRRLITHYWGLCSLIDAQVGTLVYYLEENDLLAETIIVYTSDHGEMLGAHGIYEHHENLHYEEVIHVPSIIAHPEYSGSHDIQECVTLMDLVPTLAEWTKIPLDKHIDGKSFAPCFTDHTQNTLRDGVIIETLHLPDCSHPETGDVTISLRTPQEKYIFHWSDEDELYDLTSDPYEMSNLWKIAPSTHPKVMLLQARILQQITQDNPVFGQKLKKRMKEKQAIGGKSSKE